MEGLHAALLLAHGLLRWAVLALAGVALARCIGGARAARAWAASDTKLVRGFVIALDTQILLGLVLWGGVSPLGVRMFGQAGAAMKTAALRFFMIEHVFGMLIAVAVTHVLVARSRRLGEDPARFRKTAIAVGVGLVLVAVSIPWPFLPYGRPLLRL